jgi:hypothetical protein
VARPKKSDRARYPSGKLKPETAPPVQVRRIIDEAKRAARDPLLGFELGRLRLTDVLTDSQTAAGMRFAAIVGAYDRTKGLPRRTAKSPSLEIGFGSAVATEREDDEIIEALRNNGGDVAELAKTSDIVRVVLKASKRYGDALATLRAAGKSAERVVFAVALDDDVVECTRHHDLRRGLTALADHFRLTGQFRK